MLANRDYKNGRDVTPSTQTQSSDQEYSYLSANKRHP